MNEDMMMESLGLLTVLYNFDIIAYLGVFALFKIVDKIGYHMGSYT